MEKFTFCFEEITYISKILQEIYAVNNESKGIEIKKLLNGLMEIKIPGLQREWL